jgi:hypothetical protein
LFVCKKHADGSQHSLLKGITSDNLNRLSRLPRSIKLVSKFLYLNRRIPGLHTRAYQRTRITEEFFFSWPPNTAWKNSLTLRVQVTRTRVGGLRIPPGALSISPAWNKKNNEWQDHFVSLIYEFNNNQGWHITGEAHTDTAMKIHLVTQK